MSNKTPKKPDVATESAHKKSFVQLLFGLLLLVIGGYALFSGISGLTDNKQHLIAPEGIITIEIADTTESRFQGLSNRDSLDANEGMMFVFDEPIINNCLVMRDMNFSLDMVWLNEEKRVVTIASDVAPETYPEVFCPEEPAKYALEINSGRADELGIAQGEVLRF